MSDMNDLATWLLGLLAEDERLVQEAGEARLAWATYRDADGSMMYTSPVAEHGDTWVTAGEETQPTSVLVVFDPARVLAECDAKRRIVKLHKPCIDEPECHVDGPHGNAGACLTLVLIAQPYADREGFQDSWKP